MGGGLTEEVVFELVDKQPSEASWGRSVPGRRNGLCKGPGVGIERSVRLKQNEDWRVVQILVIDRFLLWLYLLIPRGS